MQTTEAKTTLIDASLTSLGSFVGQVYGWMSLGLLISAGLAFYLYVNPDLVLAIVQAELIFPIFLVELLLVLALQSLFTRVSAFVSLGLFAVYSALNGIVFGLILYQYSATSIFVTFGATAGTFAVMSVYGLVAKQDLTRFGQLAIMGLIGLIIGSVVNIFTRSDAFGWFLTYLGIAIFVVLVAYESQKIKDFHRMGEQTGGGTKFAIYAAFSLYLSFINIFLLLLRIFGRER